MGTHTVAWWDPAVLALDAEEHVGVRHQRLLEAGEDGTQVARGEEAHVQWKDGRSAAVAQASRSSMTGSNGHRICGSARLADLDLSRVQIETVERVGAERPGGPRFGALVHAVLATVNLDASPDEIAAVGEANGRLTDATRGEIDAAIATVRAALQHPLMQRAARALALRRENACSAPANGGKRGNFEQKFSYFLGVPKPIFAAINGPVAGIARTVPSSKVLSILLFKRTLLPSMAGAWLISRLTVKLKNAQNQYLAQVAAYVDAVHVATELQVRGFLLVV